MINCLAEAVLNMSGKDDALLQLHRWARVAKLLTTWTDARKRAHLDG